jgi:23S rRNA (guanosine2251-2'-O)-methyltransferase
MQAGQGGRMRRLRGRHGAERPPSPPAVGRAAEETPRGAAVRNSPAREAAERAAKNAWIYGRHAVAAVLGNPERRLRRAVALAEAQPWLVEGLAASRARRSDAVAVEALEREALEALVPEGAVHQGVAVRADPLPELGIDDLAVPAASEGPEIVVFLDQVSDPHNVGAVLRSAAVFGARAVVVPEHGSPSTTGVLSKAASGALEHVPLIRVTNLVRSLERLKKAGFWSVGLDETAEAPLATLDMTGRIALVLGAEGEGLRRLTRERCDFLARLPARGPLASLNVSNAAAVALYELVRARPPEKG